MLARFAAAEQAPAAAAPDHGPVLAPDQAAAGDPLAELMLRFEGLGGSCEFGLMQRHFGAEPLGLLRWVSIGMRPLRTALDRSFEGVGEAEHTGLKVNRERGEYYTADPRNGMVMHTFIAAGSQDEDVLLARLCRRLQFLRRKLLDDLADGAKIFVFKASVPVRDADIGHCTRPSGGTTRPTGCC